MTSEIKDTLECSICANIFDDPKQLCCGHTYCQSCVQKLTISSAVQNDLSSFSRRIPSVTCPQCRMISMVPVEGLKTNYIVREIIATLKEIELKESRTTIGCGHCKRRISKEEVFACSTCKNNTRNSASLLCGVCAIKLHKGHDLDVCEDFVTEENREEAAGLIEKDGESVPSCINKLIISERIIHDDIATLYAALGKKVREYSNQLETLQVECLNSDIIMMKCGIDQRVEKSKKIRENLSEVASGTDLFASGVLSEVEKFKDYLEAVFTATDSNGSNQLNSHNLLTNSPSCSTQAHQGSRNIFEMDEDKKVRQFRRKKLRRSRGGLS